jgi:diguanylate cyclase (GGDEF)-like protein/PAS domain S-box-containing protein
VSTESSKEPMDNATRTELLASGAADWSHDQLQVILDQTLQAVVVLDADQQIIKAFRGGLDAWGMTADEAVGRDSADLVHRDDLDYLMNLWDEALSRPGVTLTFEARVIRDGNQWRWAEGTVKNLLADPQIGGMVYIFRDCHDRKQLEQESQKSELRFQTLVNTLADAIVGVDLTQSVVVWNISAEEMFGYTEEEIVGQPLSTLLPQGLRGTHSALVKGFAAGAEDRRPMAGGSRMVALRRDGSEFPIEVGLAKVPFGEHSLLLATVRDITDRRQAQDSIDRAHGELQAVMSAIPDAIYRLSANGVILDIMAGGASGLPISVESIGHNIADTLPSEAAQICQSGIDQALRVNAVTHSEFTVRLTDDAGPRSFESRHVPLLGNEVLAVVRDVTERELAAKRLQTASDRFRTLAETSFESLVVVDKDGIISYMGGPSQTSLGYPAEDFVGAPLLSIIPTVHPDHRDRVVAEYERTSREPGVRSVIEALFLHRDKSWHWLQISSRNLYDDESVAGLVINLRDITTERAAIEELSRSSDRFRVLADLSFDGIMVINAEHEIVYRGGPTPTSLGYDKNDLINTSVLDLINNAHPDDRDRVRAAHYGVMAQPHTRDSLKARFRHVDGSWTWLSVVIENLFHEDAIRGLVVSTTDITAQVIAEAELKHQAFHDSLTGLPNRSLLLDRLQHAMARSDRRGGIVGLLFLDLDRFKNINDTLGHAAGDQLLIGVSERLQNVVRDSDTLARLGGDEFVVLGEDAANTEELFTMAERMLESLSDPIPINDGEFFTTASIGVAVAQGSGQDAGTLMRNADAAMYRAKRGGRNRIEAYDEDLQVRLEHRINTETALRGALERDEFTVHYQPIFDVETVTITGVEALIRWNHPTRGLVAPDDFVPIAEETDLIRSIGEWVTRTACQQIVDWRDRSGVDLTLAVNISARELVSEQLLITLAKTIEETGMAAERLCLEITETALIDQPDIAVSNLVTIKDLGIKLALDDFGTGYASLAYLRTLPITQIKVDKSFTSGLGVSPDDTTIVESTITLAHDLGVSVVAEGVETQEQMEYLKRFGCVHAQGYFLGRPKDAKDLELLLLAGHDSK